MLFEYLKTLKEGIEVFSNLVIGTRSTDNVQT